MAADINHINSVVRFNTAVKKIVTSVINDLRPAPRYATVVTVDALNGVCNVLFPGDTDTTPVNMSNSVAPSLMNPDFSFNPSMVVVGGVKGNLHVIEVVNNWAYVKQPVIEEPFVSGYPRLLTINQNETHGASYFQAISSALPSVGDAWYMGAWMGLTANMGTVDLVVDQDEAGGQTKKYSFGLTNASAQNTDWMNLIPLTESGNQFGADFNVEIKFSASAYSTYAALSHRVNLCKNPAAAVNTSLWTTVGSQPPTLAQINKTPGLSISTKCFGFTWISSSSAVNTNGATSSFACTVGQQYTISTYVFIPTGSTPLIMGVTGLSVGTASTVTNAWQRISYTFTATATTHKAAVYASAAQSLAHVAYFGDLLFEKSSSVLSYFDGDSSSSFWTGAAGLSTSNYTYDPSSGLNTSNTANGFALRIRRVSAGAYDTVIGSTCYRAQLWVYGERPYPSMWGSDSTSSSDVDVTSFGNLASWINGGTNHPVGTYPVPTKTYGVATTAGVDGLGMLNISTVQPQDFGGSSLSPYLSSIMRANEVLSGGGVVGWDGSNMTWSQRFMIMGLGKNSMIPSGYWEIGPCVGGVAVPVYAPSAGITTVNTIANGVPLNNWNALYYELPLFNTHTFVEANLRIVDYNGGPTKVPAHWVFLGIYNTDGQSPALFVGTGDEIDLPTTLTLGTNLAAFGSPYSTLTYQKTNGQIVHLTGVIQASASITAGTVIATLPAGYRPKTQQIFYCAKSGNAGTRVDVLTNGQIQTVAALSSSDYLSLCGITFMATA